MLAVAQDLAAVRLAQRFAEQVGAPGDEARAVVTPPGGDSLRLRPAKVLVVVEGDVVVVGIVVGAWVVVGQDLQLQVEQRQVGAGDQAEGLAGDPRQTLVAHLLDQPGHRHRIAEQAGGLDADPPRVRRLHQLANPGHAGVTRLPGEQHHGRRQLERAGLPGERTQWPQRLLVAHLRGGPVGPEAQARVIVGAIGANIRHQVAPTQLAGGARGARQHRRVGVAKGGQQRRPRVMPVHAAGGQANGAEQRLGRGQQALHPGPRLVPVEPAEGCGEESRALGKTP